MVWNGLSERLALAAAVMRARADRNGTLRLRIVALALSNKRQGAGTIHLKLRKQGCWRTTSAWSGCIRK